MASLKLVEQSRSGALIGFLGMPSRNGAVQRPDRSVHDGDTIVGRALANVDVRFLGMDTPEVSFQLPGSKAFVDIGDARWATFLADPFNGWTGPTLPRGLVRHLSARTKDTTAANHARHAVEARDHLRAMVAADVESFAGGDLRSFSYFIRYAFDALDRYGRLLGYINVNVPEGTQRPLTYNERMLQAGLAMPYFIWANLDPFKRSKSLLEAVFAPSDVGRIASTGALGDARRWVAAARKAGKGVFDAQDPLLLEAFELRFLAGRRLPDRAVIDLSGRRAGLVPATEYYRVPRQEDRLFVPAEYVPLFKERGW